MICPEASAAKGCAQNSGQGIPTSATGARGPEDVARACQLCVARAD